MTSKRFLCLSFNRPTHICHQRSCLSVFTILFDVDVDVDFFFPPPPPPHPPLVSISLSLSRLFLFCTQRLSYSSTSLPPFVVLLSPLFLLTFALVRSTFVCGDYFPCLCHYLPWRGNLRLNRGAGVDEETSTSTGRWLSSQSHPPATK